MKTPLLVVTALLAGGLLAPAVISGPVVSRLRPDIPQRLVIPAINVDAPVETVGLDANGNMAVPTNIYGVGWYQFGPKPGETGQAVIDGHFNTPQLTPSVFWELKKLKPNDDIIIRDKTGLEYRFKVDRLENLDTNNFPVQRVFGPTGERRLNLITCDGVYDPTLGTYNTRLVVYSVFTPLPAPQNP